LNINERVVQVFARTIVVPEARDGSQFNPSLKRGDGYRVGAKDDELVCETFEEALQMLRKMPKPQWRRPNSKGNWGIVTGVTWGPLRNS
jgi:hypothetical protein